MFVQVLSFRALGPQAFVNDHTNNWDAFRAAVASLPWLAQFAIVLVASDFVQYWFHRSFHKFPFLWGFHAIHHSAKSMDWLAGSRMHFVEIILLRSITSLPLRSEEHTSELQSLMRISYAVFCLKKKKQTPKQHNHYT